MRLKPKLQLTSAVLLFVTTGLVVALFLAGYELAKQLEIHSLAREMEGSVVEMVSLSAEYSLWPGPDSARRWRENMRETGDRVNAAIVAFEADPRVLSNKLRRIQETFAELEQTTAPELRRRRGRDLVLHTAELGEEFQRVSGTVHRRLGRARVAQVRTIAWWAVALLGFSVAATVYFLRLVGQLGKALRTLEEAATRFGRGDLAYRVTLSGDVAFRSIGTAFNRMAADIDGMIRDIGAHQRARRELERSNQELEMFAHVVSHDLREPLRMITCYLRLLRSRYEKPLGKEGLEFIGYATDGAERMKEFLAALVEYSRVGQAGLDIRSVDLEALLQQTVRDLRVLLEESHGQVTWDSLPVVSCDPIQMAQVLQNLIINALKFRRAGVAPLVHVSAVHYDGKWEIRIQDNGVGVPAEGKARLFQIFQRLHSRQEFPGTGVGLALCKRIVSRHHGEIGVRPAPGPGSIFYFWLPDNLQSAVATRLVEAS